MQSSTMWQGLLIIHKSFFVAVDKAWFAAIRNLLNGPLLNFYNACYFACVEAKVLFIYIAALHTPRFDVNLGKLVLTNIHWDNDLSTCVIKEVIRYWLAHLFDRWLALPSGTIDAIAFPLCLPPWSMVGWIPAPSFLKCFNITNKFILCNSSHLLALKLVFSLLELSTQFSKGTSKLAKEVQDPYLSIHCKSNWQIDPKSCIHNQTLIS